MNLNLIRHKFDTETLLLSITKICELLIKQTHRKAEETLEFKLTKPRQTIHLKTPLSIEVDWMIGLTSLEVYKSNFNKPEEYNKFELYAGFFYNELSYTTLKDKVAEIVFQTNLARI